MAVPLAVSFAVPLVVPLVAVIVAVVEEEQGLRRPLLPPEEAPQRAVVDEEPRLGILGANSTQELAFRFCIVFQLWIPHIRKHFKMR